MGKSGDSAIRNGDDEDLYINEPHPPGMGFDGTGERLDDIRRWGTL